MRSTLNGDRCGGALNVLLGLAVTNGKKYDSIHDDHSTSMKEEYEKISLASKKIKNISR